MIAIDLGKNIVNGGFFLLNGRASTPFRWSNTAHHDFRFVGTYRDSGTPIRNALLEAIRHAQRRVFVTSFLVGDEQFLEELIAAADRLKGGVYVITALDEQSLRRGLAEYEEGEQGSSEERRKNSERLTARGVYVRGHEQCHAKFAVVDDDVALVGSANLVTQAFAWTDEANILLRVPSAIRQLQRLFTELWYSGCTWEVPPGKTYVVAQRAPQKSPCQPDPPSDQPGEVVWTNGPEQVSLLRAIQRTIDSARKELILSTYSIVGMTQKPHLILEHLKRALQRGVNVRLFIRQRNAWQEQMAEVVAFDDMGVEIFGDLRNHAKVAIADGKQAVVFSANLDGNYGLDAGVEVGVTADEATCVRELVTYMNHVIAHADAQFVRNPTLSQLDGQLAARWCKKWPWSGKVTVKCFAAEAEAFARTASQGVVLFEHMGDDLRLFAGDLELVIDTRLSTWRGQIVESSKPAGERLVEWLRSVRESQTASAESRGFCSATLHLEPDS